MSWADTISLLASGTAIVMAWKALRLENENRIRNDENRRRIEIVHRSRNDP